MRRVFTALVLLLSIITCGFAQAPQKMSYQCVVRNSSGTLVTNQSVGIKISILQGSTSGNVVYQETYNPNPQTNANGLVTVEIGGGVPLSGTFSTIDWASGTYFLKTETDPTGGTNYTISGTSQLLSVPYALHAKTAENGFSGNYNDLTNLPNLYDGNWTSISGKPTTLSGYGIVDALSTSHPASMITSTLISNWNTAFGWGNHAGLYRPISYVPTWNEITGKPTTLAGYGITDAVNTTANQTIAGNKTFTGIINASSLNIGNVANPINAQDAATKVYVDDAIELKITMLENSLNAGGLIKDIDRNYYNTVVIGTQTWMAENLKTTKYNDGTPITYTGTDYTSWVNNTSGAYAWFNNDEATYKTTYGALYNRYTVNTSKLCPSDWHVPTDDEWTTLITYLGGESIAGGKLKETGTTHWYSPNTGATNETGFTALPGGFRDSDGSAFGGVEGNGLWWSATQSDNTGGWFRSLFYDRSDVQRGALANKYGLSVRCLKDN
jgi:uncharacterized protein (TIGR02145 family)